MSPNDQMDFWPLVTVSDVNPPLRDNRDAMEYPFLSLQKKRTRPIEFMEQNVHISVAADIRYSIATIWDWDLIILIQAHINEKIESGYKVGPRISFVPYDILKQMGRSTGGRDYRELVRAIRRLRVTTVITNIRYDDEAGEERPFSWLADYRIPKRYSLANITPNSPDGDPDPTRPWEIELPPWLFNSIVRRKEILAVHPDYFKLTGGVERWLYRLARKAVPDKADTPAIVFGMDKLHRRSGVTRELKKFAYDLRQIEKRQPLPEYGITIFKRHRTDYVTLFRDRSKPKRSFRGRKHQIMIDGKAS